MNDSPSLDYRPHERLPLRFVAGVTVALALALLVFVLVMRPPAAELRAMASFLAITALISVVAGYVAYRLGWLSRSPWLIWTLLADAGQPMQLVLTPFLALRHRCPRDTGRCTGRILCIYRHCAGPCARAAPAKTVTAEGAKIIATSAKRFS